MLHSVALQMPQREHIISDTDLRNCAISSPLSTMVSNLIGENLAKLYPSIQGFRNWFKNPMTLSMTMFASVALNFDSARN